MNTIEDFIGIFPNVISEEYCDFVIRHFNWLEETRKTQNRQRSDGVSSVFKDNELYRFDITLEKDTEVLKPFCEVVWKCLDEYVEKYGVLSTLDNIQISPSIKIQKTKKSEGYHIWHCEHGSSMSGRRLLLVMLYLNNVDSGGETEFLYQSKRVVPEQGTVVICPSGFTHTHRGNPPLTGEKYIINTWIEFV
jgi:hypothetical protein